MAEARTDISEVRSGVSRLETMFASMMEKLQSNSILVKIHQLDYVISGDVLEQVFARFGDIEYLEVFSSDDDYHSKIRFRSPYSAYRAFDSLNHRNIYEGCCRLELFRVKDVVEEQEIEPPSEEFPYESAKSLSSNLDEESAKTSYTESDLIKMMNERTILVKIHLEWYPISCEVLDQVFSGIGNWKSIEILSPEDEFHSRICFQDRKSAVRALESMNLKYIYAGCCRMELFLEAEIVDRTSKIESSNQKISEDSVMDEQGKQAPDFTVGNELQGCQEDTKATVEDTEAWTEIQNQCGDSNADEWMEFPHIVKDSAFQEGIDISNRLNDESKDSGVSIQQIVDNSGEQEFACDSLIISSTAMIGAEMETIDENYLRNLVKTGIREVSIGYLERFPVAHKVFAKMTDEKVLSFESKMSVGQSISDRNLALRDGTLIFDPGIVKLGVVSSKFFKVGTPTDLREESGISFLIALDQLYAQSSCFDGPKFVNEFPISRSFDRGKVFVDACYFFQLVSSPEVCLEMVNGNILVFDPGICILHFESAEVSSDEFETKTAHRVLKFDGKPDRDVKVIFSFIQLRFAHQVFDHSYWIFDPGGTDIDAQDLVLKSIFDFDIVYQLFEEIPGGILRTSIRNYKGSLSCRKGMASLSELRKVNFPQITEIRALDVNCWTVTFKMGSGLILVFDPGGVFTLITNDILCSTVKIVCCCLEERLCDKLTSRLDLVSLSKASEHGVLVVEGVGMISVWFYHCLAWVFTREEASVMAEVVKRSQWDPGRSWRLETFLVSLTNWHQLRCIGAWIVDHDKWLLLSFLIGSCFEMKQTWVPVLIGLCTH